MQVRTAGCHHGHEHSGRFYDASSSSSAETCTVSMITADEVCKYQYKKILCIETSDLLDWWFQQEFPHNSELVNLIHVIPASSVASERSFSSAEFVIHNRRICLKTRRVTNII